MGGVGMGMQNTGTTGLSAMGGISMQNTGVSGVGSTFDYNAPPNPNAVASSGFLPPPDVGGGLMDAGRDGASVGGVSPGGSYINSTNNNSYQPPPPTVTSPGGLASSQGGYNPPEGLPPGAGAGTGPNSSSSYAYPGAAPQEELWNPTEDPILPLSSTGLGIDGGTEGPKGGKFATFPVRGRGYSLRDESGTAQSENAFASSGGGVSGVEGPASLGAARRKDTSGSDFMAAVLDAGEFGGGRSREGVPPMPTQPGQGQGVSVGIGSAFSSKQQERDRERERARQAEVEEAAPAYRDYEPTSHSQVPFEPYAAPSGPPPGAAPPVVGGVWMGGGESREEAQGSTLRAPGTPSLSVEEEGGGDRRSTTLSEDISLAYMSIGIDEPPPIEGEGEKERQARLSKHVRFGDDSVFEEQAPEPPYMKRKESNSSIGTGRSRRVAPPTMSPVEDERALNAAAAREVSRELDALNFPQPPAPQVQVQNDGQWEFANTSPSREPAYGGSPPKARGDYLVSSPQNQYNPPLPSPIANANQYVAPLSPLNREPSPLIPPAAPFSRKATLDTTVAPGGLAGIGAGHQNTPSWDGSAPGPAQPAPFAPGHHSTPSWALSPASPADGSGSPISGSPRLETPYRAPIANRSTSSLNTQVPPGARTISAAAFRRPIKTASSSDLADTSPLAPKKRLPASPYPQARTTGSGLRDASPQPPPPPQQQQHQEDDSYDYISAYTNGGRDSQAFHDDGAGSPMAADFDYGRLGKVGVVGGPPTSPGYSEGRFATDLDPNGLR
ncbi:hypothetical protein C8F04DRAFT_1081095 [Mycena alexandri]|uniref:Uncharacterized protein n=1 Tax=Mycena alexandri TaxID=1745969 RepID=A0AAD6TBK5_9AGAR|nr:hypothetical protein C8F04DRAFT_1081095 [Mycena alexandri]